MSSKIIIFANTKYLEKCKNILLSFHRLNIDNYLFLCMDNKTFIELPTKNKRLSIIEFEDSWNGKKKLWIERVKILSRILHEEEHDIIHVDADTEWLKNPISLFNDNSFDMYFTCGLNYPDGVFDKWKFVLRGGFFYLRNNEFVKSFTKKWITYVEKYTDDQVALNIMIDNMGVKWEIPDDKYYIRNYLHSNGNIYDIMYCKDVIKGTIDKHRICVLSAFDFPRLLTGNDAYVLDLYYQSEYILSR